MVTLAVAWAMIPVAQRMAIPPMSSGWFEVSLLTARETMIGLILGFSSRFAVFAAQGAGQLISNEMGLQSAQIFSPGSGEISNEPSVMLEFLAQAIMFGGGFYDRTLATLQPKPFTVGLGFTQGFVDDLEPEDHDEPLDAILNDNGVVWPV